MFLTHDQLRELTGKQRASAQARVLRELGVRHGVRPDGSIVVMMAAVDSALGPGTAERLIRKTAPQLALVK